MPHLGGIVTLIFIAAAVITSCNNQQTTREGSALPSLTLLE